MTRRSFITAAAFAAATSLLCACGQGNGLVTTPVTESQSIAVAAQDAVSMALSETDWPCQNAGADLNAFYDAVAAASDTAAVRAAYDAIMAKHPAVMARKGGITDMAQLKERMDTWPSVRSPEVPCAGAISAQEAANRTVQLAQQMYGADFFPSKAIDAVAVEKQPIAYYAVSDMPCEERPTWQLSVIAPATQMLAEQAENDLFLFAEFDAITAKLLNWQLGRDVGESAPYFQGNGYQWEYTTAQQAQAFDAAAQDALEAIGITAEPEARDMAQLGTSPQSGGIFLAADYQYYVNLNGKLHCIETLMAQLRIS